MNKETEKTKENGGEAHAMSAAGEAREAAQIRSVKSDLASAKAQDRGAAFSGGEVQGGSVADFLALRNRVRVLECSLGEVISLMDKAGDFNLPADQIIPTLKAFERAVVFGKALLPGGGWTP